MIKKLYSLLAKAQRRQLYIIGLFSIVISIIETIGISIIMPFIAVANDFSLIQSNQYYKTVYGYFHFDSSVDFILVFGIVLLLFYLIRAALNLLFGYINAKFSLGCYHNIAYKLFENYLGLPYKDFVSRNSAKLTKNIVSESLNIMSFIMALLMVFNELLILIFIYAYLLYVNLQLTLLITLLLGINAAFMLRAITHRIKKAGVHRELHQSFFYEVLNSSFGNFKLIKLSSQEYKILNKFDASSRGYVDANVINSTLALIPRIFLELVSFGLIILIVLYLVHKNNGNIQDSIPMISMFVVGLYRLMPSVNRIVSGYNQMIFTKKSFDLIHSELEYDIEKYGTTKIVFDHTIRLDNIIYQYENDKPVLKNINLIITKGEKIAIIGESGSGKSTLADIIMGLHKPTQGLIFIDQTPLSEETIIDWRKKIGYIPQTIYLFDGTVEENIVFGREYNKDKIIYVLKQAKIYDFLSTKEGIDTKVGEGGIMLSGGQKQRIAIARALYGEPEILILDEATSALDAETEKLIMDEIYDIGKDTTMLIVAHRLSTIEKCDRKITLFQGKIIECI